jgi:hypothetical protein
MEIFDLYLIKPLLSVSPTAAPEVDEEDETFLETESPTTTTAANGRSAISLPPSSCNGASGRSRRTLIDGNGAKSGVAKHEQLLEQLIEFV